VLVKDLTKRAKSGRFKSVQRNSHVNCFWFSANDEYNIGIAIA